MLAFGFPSLPEPTEKPPPPPTIHQDEPIYEAIQPRYHSPSIIEVLCAFIHCYLPGIVVQHRTVSTLPPFFFDHLSLSLLLFRLQTFSLLISPHYAMLS